MTQQTNPELNERRRYTKLRARLLNAAETSTGKNHAGENREKQRQKVPVQAKLGLDAHQEEESIPMPHGSPAPVHAPTARLAKSNTSRGGGEPRRPQVHIGDALRGKECLLCAAPRRVRVWRVRYCGVPRLGGSSPEAGCCCGFGSGRLVGAWTAGVVRQWLEKPRKRMGR